MEVKIISGLEKFKAYKEFVEAKSLELSAIYKAEADKIMNEVDVDEDVKLANLNKLRLRVVKERTQSDIIRKLKEASTAVKDVLGDIRDTTKEYEASIRSIEEEISKPLEAAKEKEAAIKRHYREALDWLNQTIALMTDPSTVFNMDQIESIQSKLAALDHPDEKPSDTVVSLKSALSTLVMVKKQVLSATQSVIETNKEDEYGETESPVVEDDWISKVVDSNPPPVSVAEQAPRSVDMETYINSLIDSLSNVEYRDAVIEMRKRFELVQLSHNTISIGNAVAIVCEVLGELKP